MKKRGLLALAIYMLIFILVLVVVLAARSIIVKYAFDISDPEAQLAANSINALLIVVCVVCFIPLFFKLLHVVTGLKAFGYLCMLIDCYVIYIGITSIITSIKWGYSASGTIIETLFFVVALISNAVSVFRRSE